MKLFYTIVDYALRCKKKANELDEKIKTAMTSKEKSALEAKRDRWIQKCVDIQGLASFPLILSKPEEDYLSSKRKGFPSKGEVCEWWDRSKKRWSVIEWTSVIIIWSFVLWNVLSKVIAKLLNR